MNLSEEISESETISSVEMFSKIFDVDNTMKPTSTGNEDSSSNLSTTARETKLLLARIVCSISPTSILIKKVPGEIGLS